MLGSGRGILSRNITRQDVGTHMASIKTVLHPLWGNVKLSHACQVKVNAAEGQTFVFISIILHNNTYFFFFFFKGQKRENRCNKKVNLWQASISGEMFIYKPRLKTHVVSLWLQCWMASTAILHKFILICSLKLSTEGIRLVSPYSSESTSQTDEIKTGEDGEICLNHKTITIFLANYRPSCVCVWPQPMQPFLWQVTAVAQKLFMWTCLW